MLLWIPLKNWYFFKLEVSDINPKSSKYLNVIKTENTFLNSPYSKSKQHILCIKYVKFSFTNKSYAMCLVYISSV